MASYFMEAQNLWSILTDDAQPFSSLRVKLAKGLPKSVKMLWAPLLVIPRLPDMPKD
jgi:hypothetical protein